MDSTSCANLGRIIYPSSWVPYQSQIMMTIMWSVAFCRVSQSAVLSTDLPAEASDLDEEDDKENQPQPKRYLLFFQSNWSPTLNLGTGHSWQHCNTSPWAPLPLTHTRCSSCKFISPFASCYWQAITPIMLPLISIQFWQQQFEMRTSFKSLWQFSCGINRSSSILVDFLQRTS